MNPTLTKILAAAFFLSVTFSAPGSCPEATHTFLITLATARANGTVTSRYLYDDQSGGGPSQISITTNLSNGAGVTASVEAHASFSSRRYIGSARAAITGSPEQGSAHALVLLSYAFKVEAPTPYTLSLSAAGAVFSEASFVGLSKPVIVKPGGTSGGTQNGILQPGPYSVTCYAEPTVNGGSTASFDLQLDTPPTTDLAVSEIRLAPGSTLPSEYTVPFTIENSGDPTESAATVKAYWATGGDIANRLADQPVAFNASVPALFCGEINFEVPWEVIRLRPDSATHLIVVLDEENQVPEKQVPQPDGEKNNTANVAVPRLCTIAPLSPHIAEPAYEDSGLNANLLSALSCFENALVANGGRVVKKTTGVRTQAYQAHLYEIWTKFNATRGMPGVTMQVINGYQQLVAADEALVCESVLQGINEEIILHEWYHVPPAVARPGTSRHELGRAVDWTVSLRSDADASIGQLAANCGLGRPVRGELWHYELAAEPPSRRARFAGRSPVNILVQDPMGRRVGFDPVSNTAMNEVGASASYSGPGSTPQFVEIAADQVLSGDYHVSGIGTGSGGYTIDIEIMTEEDFGDTFQRILATGTAQAGQSVGPIPPIDCIASAVFLQIERAGTNLVVMGSSWATNLVLEASSAMTNGSWTVVQQPISSTNGFVISVPSQGSKFFRLRSGQ